MFFFPFFNQETPETPDINTCQNPRRYLQLLDPGCEDNYGMNYNGWHRKEQKEVAITIVKDIENKKRILQEVDILEAVKGHKNVIGFYGAFYHPASVKMPEREGLWISMERWSGVSVQDLINTRRSLSEDWIAYICREVLQGLCHLHKQNVIHHDLRPQNIIVTSSADVKITDFSSATMGTSSVSTSGTIPYMAPEVLSNISTKIIRYNSKADIWSLGISALEMAEGYYPFSRYPENKLMKRVMHGPAPTLLWDKWSDNFRAFIREILQKNAAWRPSAEQLLLHPFILNISNERGVTDSIKWYLH
ncbi:hypothetical protein XELAEV_18015992mg [Xenopus laevis]|uniref:Protein kinase domain-containing protein n=1 Tax=Xenopus laevis TaxID=8355 RepID=A0A974DKP4_XENLA|nr:hypothetical protein XELAEV_18015992mg [Xenopus laevis]